MMMTSENCPARRRGQDFEWWNAQSVALVLTMAAKFRGSNLASLATARFMKRRKESPKPV